MEVNKDWKRGDILRSIQKLDAEIASLNQQKQQLFHELKSFSPAESPVIIAGDFSFGANESIGRTAKIAEKVIAKGDFLDEKVRFFKDLFRGRADVYAKRWVSRKSGKSGYSPVCKNEWLPKICQKWVFYMEA